MWGSFVFVFQEVLGWLSSVTGSLGLGIILFTILTRILLLPLTIKQLQSSKKMQEIQPLIQELRRKYGKDQQKFTQEMTRVYREHRVNPAGSCLPIFVQIPIFLGVWQAVQNLATNPEMAGSFLWLPSLAQKDPLYILPILSIIFQMLVSVMAMPKIQDPQQKAISQTMLLMPLVFGYVAFTFNSGAVLYWVVGALLGVVQQYFITGWGSLTNYLPFLPERRGYFTPTPMTLPATSDAGADQGAAPEPDRNFWAPLAKLQTVDGTPDDAATEAAIAEARRQGRGKKRR